MTRDDARDGATLGALAQAVDGRVVGDATRRLRRVATLAEAGPDCLGFLTHPRYRAEVSTTRAGALVIDAALVGEDGEVPDDLARRDLLAVRRPHVALATLIGILHPERAMPTGVDPASRVAADAAIGDGVHVGPFAVIESGARIGAGASIGAGSYVGRDAIVGEPTRLHPRVVVYEGCRVGSDCILHSGVVLGADGFGFAEDDGRHRKVPQIGSVVLEDDVEVGANSAIDRGAVSDTRIGAGSKIDDLVMVAHGVRLGPGALLVAQSGIAGSATLGERLTLAGQAGIAGHLSIGDRVVVAAKSAVFQDVPSDSFVAGIPAIDHREWKRIQAASRKLTDLRAQVRELRRRLDRVEGAGGEAQDREGG